MLNGVIDPYTTHRERCLPSVQIHSKAHTQQPHRAAGRHHHHVFIARVLPSNPEVKWAGQRATEEQLEQARIELGLNKSLPEQYVIYLGELLRGDLGRSLNTHQPVTDELARYIPATLELVVLAFIFAIIIGIPLGIYSAKKKDRFLDHAGRIFSISNSLRSASPPSGCALFTAHLYKTLKPPAHRRPPQRREHDFRERPDIHGMLLLDTLLDGAVRPLRGRLPHILLPCLTISLYPIGLVSRMTRSALLEILARGLHHRRAQLRPQRGQDTRGITPSSNSIGTTATDVALSMATPSRTPSSSRPYSPGPA